MTDADAASEQTDTEARTQTSGLRVPFSGAGSKGAARLRVRLSKLIAAKLALDLLFACGLAVYTHAVTYRTGFAGELEHADGLSVSGWVADLERPDSPVELQLFLNGHFASSTLATEPAAGNARERDHRAFVFRFEQPRFGEYEARVYAAREGRGGARRTLQQIGDARRFTWK